MRDKFRVGLLLLDLGVEGRVDVLGERGRNKNRGRPLTCKCPFSADEILTPLGINVGVLITFFKDGFLPTEGKTSSKRPKSLAKPSRSRCRA
eukprot:scaffold4060_cov190-Amphora_coffeaeformis.AAC.26